MRGHTNGVTQITTRREHQSRQQCESARSRTIKERSERLFGNVASAAISKSMQTSQSTTTSSDAPDRSDHHAGSASHRSGRRFHQRLVAAKH
jgi:hypothetical protein